jgi:uncharacterized protein YuzE
MESRWPAVRITYDRVADAATIYLTGDIGPGGAPKSLMCDLEVDEGAVILLLDDGDRIVGIEVLGASGLLPTELLDAADGRGQ